MQCPHCSESIDEKNTRCPYCRQMVRNDKTGARLNIVIIIAIIVLLAAIATFFRYLSIVN